MKFEGVLLGGVEQPAFSSSQARAFSGGRASLGENAPGDFLAWTGAALSPRTDGDDGLGEALPGAAATGEDAVAGGKPAQIERWTCDGHR